MIQKIGLAGLVLAFAACGSTPSVSAPRPKAQARLAQIRVVGDAIEVPLPAGYCEPTGTYVDTAQVSAAGDSQNLTLLSLFSCAEMARGATPEHFAYVKIPKSALSAHMTLPELLSGMGAVPDSEMKAAIDNDKVSPGVQKDLSTVTGRDVAVHTAIVPADRDANGYYMAGVVQMSAGTQEITTAVAVALTAVKGHMLSYNFYAPGQTSEEVRAVLEQTKAETKRLVAAN